MSAANCSVIGSNRMSIFSVCHRKLIRRQTLSTSSYLGSGQIGSSIHYRKQEHSLLIGFLISSSAHQLDPHQVLSYSITKAHYSVLRRDLSRMYAGPHTLPLMSFLWAPLLTSRTSSFNLLDLALYAIEASCAL